MAGENDEREKFMQVYQVLKKELLEDPSLENDHVSLQWLRKMMDYTVTGGKQNRAMYVIQSYKLLNEGKQLSEDDFFRACVLGWCIQWAMGSALVLDDIMDNSHIRRGQPCWFRVPKVGLIAINDGIVLGSQISKMLKKHFRDQPYYADLLDLFNEISFQTACGEMIDLISTLEAEGEKAIFRYTIELYRRICIYKTAYGTFYVPFALAMILSGEKLDEYTEAKDILLEIGIYFQAQDDYLDCYGDPERIGKIGTDIEECKCSWLVVKALELSNEEQKKLLYDNYMKSDPEKVAIIKSLYKDLNIEGAFAEYEVEVYENLIVRIEAIPSKIVQAVLKSFLDKIYMRQK